MTSEDKIQAYAEIYEQLNDAEREWFKVHKQLLVEDVKGLRWARQRFIDEIKELIDHRNSLIADLHYHQRNLFE